MAQKFPEKFPENLTTVEFLKCKPFNQNFQKVKVKNKMEQTFPGINFWKFWYISQLRLSSFSEMQGVSHFEFLVETGKAVNQEMLYVPFATGNARNFQAGNFGQMENVSGSNVHLI